MRVIGGSAGSLRLQCPQGLQIRPTADMIRETLFNSLGPGVAGTAFCDLYAGCGSVGIEAGSRGARVVVFIERSRRAVEAIEANLEHTGLGDVAAVIRGDVMSQYDQAARRWGPFDIVFADPPYMLQELAALGRRLIVGREGLTETGVVVLQHSSHHALPELPEPSRVKDFGESMLSFFEATGESR
ncbi:MAG: 16S rRNA (guanine(966)-N(2))-methyltransferase RsmD [Armatimonadota bacterium]|nr:16S rRNA (guanine(966)-N(2))-methyltransferase RsmD [Armatimonadota bacterium]